MPLFGFVPILRGRYLTYQEYFVFAYSVLCLMSTFAFWLVAKVCKYLLKNEKLKYYLSKQYRDILHQKSISYQDERDSKYSLSFDQLYQPVKRGESVQRVNIGKNNQINQPLVQQDYKIIMDQQQNESDEKEQKVNGLFYILYVGYQFFKWVSILIFCLLFLIMSGLDYISSVASAFIVFGILIFSYSYLQFRNIKTSGIKIKLQTKLKLVYGSNLKLNLFLLILFITYAVFGSIFFHSTCMCFYTSKHGSVAWYLDTKDLFVSTGLTRSLSIKKACPTKSKPCHIYATLPPNPSSSVFLNVQTGVDRNSVNIYYDQETYYNQHESTTRYSSVAKSYSFEKFDSQGERKLHTALLKDLEPNTMYVFLIKYSDGETPILKRYKTLPEQYEEFTFISAGDVGNYKAADQVGQQVSKYKPQLMIIGGDLAYDNGLPSCVFTWDYFMDRLEQINEDVGYIIPWLFQVGNHDIGLNSLPRRFISVDINGPPYITFFPQHYQQQQQQQNMVPDIPSIQERTTFFYHEFGDIIIISMDSGYLLGYEAQAKMLRDVLQKTKAKHKFVVYHNPTYNVCGPVSDLLSEQMIQGIFYWVPLFDEFGVTAVFENHVHLFKRSKPLKGGAVAQGGKGTVYLGDGAWGTPPEKCKFDYSQGFFENANAKNHAWKITVSNQGSAYTAFDVNGQEFDQFNLKY